MKNTSTKNFPLQEIYNYKKTSVINCTPRLLCKHFSTAGKR